MAISIDWGTKIISVPQSYLTPITGNRYELDVNQFRLDLRSLEDDLMGITYLRTHKHNTEVVLGGITYARFVELVNGYTVSFESGSYIVELDGANNNILEKSNYTGVSIREKNSAGLITVSSGSGLSQDQSDKLDTVYANTENADPQIDAIEVAALAIKAIVENDTDLIDELHERFALNSARPVTHAEDGINSTNIDIDITDNQDGTFTEERQ